MYKPRKGEWAIVVGSKLFDTVTAANVTVLEIARTPKEYGVMRDTRPYYRVDAATTVHGEWRNASELQPARD